MCDYSGGNSVLYNHPLGLLICSFDCQMHFDHINKKNDLISAHSLHKRQETLCYAIFVVVVVVESKTRTQATCFYQLGFAGCCFPQAAGLQSCDSSYLCSLASSLPFFPLSSKQTRMDGTKGFSASSVSFKYYPL